MNERAPRPPDKRKITRKYKQYQLAGTLTELSSYVQKSPSGYTPALDPCTFTMSLYANMAARTASAGIFHPAFPKNAPSYWMPNAIGTIKASTGTNTQLSQTKCRDNDYDLRDGRAAFPIPCLFKVSPHLLDYSAAKSALLYKRVEKYATEIDTLLKLGVRFFTAGPQYKICMQ